MHIKSKQRVRDHGEVFTQEREVNAMLDLVKNETERIESRFLEPACGTGNFLAPILERKLALVKKRYGKVQAEFEKMALLAVSSIYGIELLEDNVVACIKRLYDIFDEEYSGLYRDKCKNELRDSIRFILERNILHGDALNFRNLNNDFLVFSEWSLVKDGMIKRRDYKFSELANLDPNQPSLFSVKDVSDTGEAVFSAMPIKEFPLKHYLSLNNYES